MKLLPPVALLTPIAALTVAACTTSTGPSEPPPVSNPSGGLCDASKAQSYVGQKATEELGAAILAETGAQMLRWGGPETAWTMDYREDRVNVRYDHEMVILDVTCG